MIFGALFAMLFVFIAIAAAVSIVIRIFYLLTLSRTLELCHQQTRTMNPGEVWMVFIPLFGLVWHFIMVGRIADSLAVEFRNRRIPVDEDRPGYQTGLWALILSCCAIIPLLGILCVLTGFVFLIMYWVRMSNYKKMLEQHNQQFGGNPYAFQQQAAQNAPQNNPYSNPFQ
jgi:hypothetical protein